MGLERIEEKVCAGGRIDDGEALTLMRSNDVHTLGRMAEAVRQRWNGNQAYFIINRHINYSNVCIGRCSFCAFSQPDKNSPLAFTYGIDEMLERARKGAGEGATEFHIVGGLHPDLPYEYYLNLLTALKSNFPAIQLKCFTAVEISHLSRLSSRSIEQVLTDLIQTGLDALPGGGAEMFSQRVRDRLCPDKLYVDEWLEVHRTAHGLGQLH